MSHQDLALFFGLACLAFVDGSTNRLAEQCQAGCSTCSPINGCVTCNRGLFLFLHRDGMRQKGHCVHACPVGYYVLRISREYRRCQHCALAYCEACTSMSYCTRCSPPYQAVQGRCIQACPANTYYANYEKQCVSQVDCMVGPWSPWGLCTRNGQTCGYKYGIQQRGRPVLQQPSANGYLCPDTSDYRECRLKYRTCADLIHNKSESIHDSRLEALLKKWRRERKRRRRKHGRKRKKKGRGKGSKERKKRPDRKYSRKRKPANRKKLRQMLPDVTTNQINVLMDADA